MKRKRFRQVVLLVAVGVGAVLAGPATRARAEVILTNRASLSFEYDDNVFLANRGLQADELGRLFYDFGCNWLPTPENEILADYQLGGKLYWHESEEDTIINQLQLGYTNYSIPQMYLGMLVTGKLRNVRDAEEDYFKFIGDACVGRRFGPVTAELRASYSQFNFRSFSYYDYWTQTYGGEVRYEQLRSFVLGTGYHFTRKAFPFNALRDIGPPGGAVLLVFDSKKRFDNLHEISVFGRYQTMLFGHAPFLVSGSYLYQINDSNSYGDSYRNHRFMLALSQDLFEGANLHILGIFQVRERGSEVQIPHSYLIEEDDENYNQIQVRLTHAFTDYFSVFAEYSRYWTHFVGGKLDFVKNLTAAGVSFSF